MIILIIYYISVYKFWNFVIVKLSLKLLRLVVVVVFLSLWRGLSTVFSQCSSNQFDSKTIYTRANVDHAFFTSIKMASPPFCCEIVTHKFIVFHKNCSFSQALSGNRVFQSTAQHRLSSLQSPRLAQTNDTPRRKPGNPKYLPRAERPPSERPYFTCWFFFL